MSVAENSQLPAWLRMGFEASPDEIIRCREEYASLRARALVCRAFEYAGVTGQGNAHDTLSTSLPSEASWTAVVEYLSSQLSADVGTLWRPAMSRDEAETALGSMIAESPLASDCLVDFGPSDADGPPLVYISSAAGGVHAVKLLQSRLSTTRIVGVRAPGLYGEQEIPTSVKSAARVCVAQLHSGGLLDRGPLLMGFSSGGLVALEIAQMLVGGPAPATACMMIEAPIPSLWRRDEIRTFAERARGRVEGLLARADAPGAIKAMASTLEMTPGGALPAEIVGAILGRTVGAGSKASMYVARQVEVYATAALSVYQYEPPRRLPCACTYLGFDDDTTQADAWRGAYPSVSVSQVLSPHSDYLAFRRNDVAELLRKWVETCTE